MRFSTTLSGSTAPNSRPARNPTCSLSREDAVRALPAFSTYRLSPVLPEAGSPEPVETVPWGEQNACGPWDEDRLAPFPSHSAAAQFTGGSARSNQHRFDGRNLDRELDFYTKVLPLNLCRERRPPLGLPTSCMLCAIRRLGPWS